MVLNNFDLCFFFWSSTLLFYLLETMQKKMGDIWYKKREKVTGPLIDAMGLGKASMVIYFSPGRKHM